MATTIYFNSRVTAIPGSYSEVDASGLAQVGLGATGIVALIGEVEGGEPGVVHRVSNPGKIGKMFKEGDLLEGGTMLFDPSKDPGIPGGAQEVMFVKVNPATQSTLTLDDDGGNPALKLASRDYGAFTERINVDVSNGSDPNTKAVQIGFDSVVETFDNIGADGVATIQYTGTAGVADVSFTHSGGLTAAVSASFAGRGNELIGTIPSNPGLNGDLAQTASLETMEITSDGTETSQITIYGLDAGDNPVSDTITLGGTPATYVNGVQTFKAGGVLGIYLHAAPGGATFTVRGNTTSTPVLAATGGGQHYGLYDWSSDPLEGGGPINVWTDGASNAWLLIIGQNGGGPYMEAVELDGVNPVTTSEAGWVEVSMFALGVVDAARTVNFQSYWFQAGQAQLSSDHPDDTTQKVTIYGMDVAGPAVQSETIQLNGTAPVTTTGSWSAIYGAEIDAVTAGNMNVFAGTSSPQQVHLFGFTPGQTRRGLVTADYVLNATTLSWTQDPTPGPPNVVAILIGTDNTGSAAMERISGASGTSSTSWRTIQTIACALTPDGIDILPAYTPFTLTESTYPTFEDWEVFFATQAEWTLTKLMVTPSADYDIEALDEFGSQSALASGYSILDILTDMAAVINAGSSFVSAEILGAATGAPANLSTAQYLSGGTEGATSFGDWQDALNLLRDYRVNTVVPLTNDTAVQAATISHCTYMCAAGRSERDCVLGATSAINLSDAKALALSMNTRHARLLIQDIQRFNTSGTKERFAPPFSACIAAGMQAGSEVGTSLTFKYLNVLDFFGNDATYTIQDDANELIQAGLCMIEKNPNVGFRWLRNVTTYLIDNNLAYCEASVNEAVNYSVYTLRTALEAIVGKKGFAGTVTAAQGIAISVLGQLVGVTAIVSYKNLTIELTGDVMTIDVEIAPVIPVNFIKTTIHLVSASFEAST